MGRPMPEPRTRLLGGLFVAASAAFYSVNGPFSRVAYRAGIEPLGLIAWRSGLGAAVLVALVLWRLRRGVPIASPGSLPGRARAALLVASLASIGTNLAVFAAFQRITVAIALLTFFTYPAWVTLAASVLHRERPTAGKLAALGMALLGVGLVVAGGLDPAEGLRLDAAGFLLALVAALLHTVFLLVSRAGYRTVPSEQAAAFFLAVGVAGYVAIALAVGALDDLAYPLRDGSVWPVLVLLGVVGAGIPLVLYLAGLRRIGAISTGILAMLEPVVAVGMAAVLLGEPITLAAIVGGALVLGAGVLLQRTREPEPGAAESEGSEGPAGAASAASVAWPAAGAAEGDP